MEELIEEAERDVRLLGEAGDDQGLARAWALRVMVANMLTDFAGMAEYSELAIHHGRLGGRLDMDLYAGLGAAHLAGPTPAPEALTKVDEVFETLPSGKAREIWLMQHRAEVLTLLGDESGARHAAIRAREHAVELGGGISLPLGDWVSAHVERGFGRLEDAERFYREADAQFRAMGERSWRSSLVCELGLVLWELGRDGEALELAQEGRELGASDDFLTQVLWRDVVALVLSRRGDTEEAERLAREALEFTERMDSPVFRADARWSLSVVLTAAGRPDAAAEELRTAIGLLDAKGASHRAAQLRDELAAIESRTDR
jgi:tetratricopeptide (TPR) repeat protein